MGLVSELRRRNVLRMAVLYLVAAWLIMQVTEVVKDLAGLSDWIGPTILGLLAVGFPIALILSWFYEITPKGISLEKDVDPGESITHITGRRLDFIVISLLSAAVILFAVHTWWIGPPPEKSIAVLPFVNMSDDASNEYFSDGVSEEILNLLTQVPDLIVTSRSSAFSFKGQNVDIPTIAAKLNVAHVLEGSVRKSGNQLRITAQLIEVVTDTHLWSKTYDRELKNVFAIQEEIAAAVVDALKITLLGKELRGTETNPEAYALYLQGRHFSNRVTAESNKQAETLLKQALEIDPRFAPAWTELGSVYRHQAGLFGLRPVDEANELAHHAILKALTIDPQYGRAYAALAVIEGLAAWDFTAASQHLQRALALDPGNASILVQASNLNTVLGRVDESIDQARQAVVLDPISPVAHMRLGRTLYLANRLEEAAVSLQMALSLSSSRYAGRYTLGWVLLAQGDAPAALVTMKQETTDAFRLTGTAVVQHALHDAEASNAALLELIETYAEVRAYQIAQVYAFRGEIDDAFRWLERAYDNHDRVLPIILLDPKLENLHDDPRWEPFLDKMGLPH